MTNISKNRNPPLCKEMIKVDFNLLNELINILSAENNPTALLQQTNHFEYMRNVENSSRWWSEKRFHQFLHTE